MTKQTLCLAAALGLLAGTPTPQADARIAPRPTGAIGVDSNQPTPEYWIDRQRHADRVFLDRGAIALQNRAPPQTDPPDRNSTRPNSSPSCAPRMPSSACEQKTTRQK